MQDMAFQWEDTLPASIQALLDVRDSELGDFAEAVRSQTVLSRLAYKRALEAAAVETYTGGEIVEMGDSTEPPGSAPILKDRDITARIDVALKANKSLVDIKQARLDAMEKFKEKASDKPKPASITFHRAETSPSILVRRLLILGRKDEAKQVAKDNRLDWAEFEKATQEEGVGA